MKKLALTTFTCALAMPVLAEDVDRSIDAASDGHVDVSNISGSVEVSGWSRNTVEVTGTLGRKVKELVVERDGKRILIKVKVPRNSGRGIESELNIKVPKNNSLDVGTVSADIDVEAVNGEQSLHTVSGDVETEYSGAGVSAESVSGDVTIEGDGSRGEVEAETVSGDVTLINVSGEVAAESVSGDVDIDEGKFTRVDLNSVNGDIEFEAQLLDDGRLRVETVNGDVDVNLAGKVSARFEIDTFNGKITNCFGPKAERTSRYGPGWELEFTEGGGDGRIEVSTLNGGVSICRE